MIFKAPIGIYFKQTLWLISNPESQMPKESGYKRRGYSRKY